MLKHAFEGLATAVANGNVIHLTSLLAGRQSDWFTYEGLFKAIVYNGRNRDTTWYATDSDWAEISKAHQLGCRLIISMKKVCRKRLQSCYTRHGLALHCLLTGIHLILRPIELIRNKNQQRDNCEDLPNHRHATSPRLERPDTNLIRLLDIVDRDKDEKVLLLTGDLANAAVPAAYQRIRTYLEACESITHCYALAGNHDDLNVMRTCFKGCKIKIRRSATVQGIPFHFLDTSQNLLAMIWSLELGE